MLSIVNTKKRHACSSNESTKSHTNCKRKKKKLRILEKAVEMDIIREANQRMFVANSKGLIENVFDDKEQAPSSKYMTTHGNEKN